MNTEKPIPYRGATYSATDIPFLTWWKTTMPTARFGAARDAYDKRDSKESST